MHDIELITVAVWHLFLVMTAGGSLGWGGGENLYHCEEAGADIQGELGGWQRSKQISHI